MTAPYIESNGHAVREGTGDGGARTRPTAWSPSRRHVRYCREFTRRHGENFSVCDASASAPASARTFYAIYAYCRWADDLGDETGGGTRALELLRWWRGELLALLRRPAAASGHGRARRDDRAVRHSAAAVPRPALRVRAGSTRQALRHLRATARLLPPFGRPGRPSGAVPVRVLRRGAGELSPTAFARRCN